MADNDQLAEAGQAYMTWLRRWTLLLDMYDAKKVDKSGWDDAAMNIGWWDERDFTLQPRDAREALEIIGVFVEREIFEDDREFIARLEQMAAAAPPPAADRR